MQEKESVNQWAGPERGRAAHDGEEHFENLVNNVLSEVNVDNIYVDKLPEFSGATLFGIEYLPGQYDQRAGHERLHRRGRRCRGRRRAHRRRV